MAQHRIVARDEWVAARKALLEKEKAFTRERDALNRLRRQLPRERVEKAYVFDGPDGEETLAGLFAGRSQLIVYHFMFGPDWDEGCKSCSFLADHYAPAVVHLAQRDVTLATVSRAPLARIEAFRERMGWRFKWVSSLRSDFNRDYQVSFAPEDVAGGGGRLQLRGDGVSDDRSAGAERVLQGPLRRRLSHVLDLRAGARHVHRRLSPARRRAQGPGRGRSRLQHGMGPAPRPLRRGGLTAGSRWPAFTRPASRGRDRAKTRTRGRAGPRGPDTNPVGRPRRRAPILGGEVYVGRGSGAWMNKPENHSFFNGMKASTALSSSRPTDGEAAKTFLPVDSTASTAGTKSPSAERR